MGEEDRPIEEDQESTEKSFTDSDNLLDNIHLGCGIIVLLAFLLGALIKGVSNLLAWLITK
ncbi:hypothetical protein ACFL2Q_08110 [Thermodesulfobacteriota bacterium]